MRTSHRLHIQKIFKTFFYLSIPLVILSISLGFAGWISFESGRAGSYVESKALLNHTSLTSEQSGCNLSVNIPGAQVSYPDDFGLLAGKYSVLSLQGQKMKLLDHYMNGTFRPDKLGRPNLPFVRVLIRIPYSVTKDQLTIEAINTQFKAVEGTFDIAPIQEQLFDSFYPDIHTDNRVFQRDMNIYNKDEYFSHELEYNVRLFRGFRIVEIIYSPVQYNPVQKTLLSTNTVEFALKYKGHQFNIDNSKDIFKSVAFKSTFNGITGVEEYDYNCSAKPTGKFIVVSAPSLMNTPTFEEWIAYREGVGYTHVGNIDADANSSSQIESEIKSQYNGEGLDFVIVVGDEDVVEIPVSGSSYHYKDWSRMDDDVYEDVGLGIFLCNTEEGLKRILDRQIWHEAGGGWTKTVMMTIGQQETENPLGRFSSPHYATRNWDNPDGGLGWTVHRVYQCSTSPTQGYGGSYGTPGPYDWEEWVNFPDNIYSSGDDALDKIYDNWNEGVAVLVHRDHGSSSGPSKPRIRMSSSVTSDCSPFFLSINCSSGNFKDNHTSNFTYLTQSGITGTCVTLAAPVTTMSGDNDYYLIGMFEGMFPEDGTPPERCIAKAHLIGQMSSSGSTSRTYFHNFGDPMTWISIGDMSPTIRVTSPNGGEEIEQNTFCNVRWADNINGNVKIELLKGGSVASTIAASTESDGIHEWQVGTTQAATDYKVRVTSVDSTALFHESENTFAVVPEYIITDYIYFEPFDTLVSATEILPYKYAQLTTDDHNWTVLSGPTPSRIDEPPDVTGPMADHTSGGEQGIYLYTEASASADGNPNKKFDYTTPKFNFKALNKPMLAFWYHMFSDNAGEDRMGDLSVDICVDGTWHPDVIKISGNQGDNWIEQTLELEPYKSDRTIFRFRAITGDSWESDICIDDIKIWDDQTAITDVTGKFPAFYDLKFYGSRVYFQVPKGMEKNRVNIKLYNLQGKLVQALVNDNVKTGYYSVPLQQLATGLYLCRMEAGKFSKTVNVILTK